MADLIGHLQVGGGTDSFASLGMTGRGLGMTGILSGDDDGWVAAAVALTGADGPECLDESVLERFQGLSAHPLPINLVSRSRLLASGLFSAYQVASLLDYRARSGDVLSAAELALVDGFDAGTAAALRHFVSFYSKTLPGVPVADTLARRVRQSVEFRSKGPAGKYRISFGERAEAGFAWRDEEPSFYGVYYGRGRLGKVVAGNFNARFAQGLALWTGFHLDDLLTPSSFVRHAGGISPSWSYNASNSFRGVAADFTAGGWDVSLLTAREGMGANAGWTWRRGRAGTTVFWPDYGKMPRLSLDVRYNPRGFQLFAEVASEPVQGHFAAVGGMVAPIGDHVRAAIRLTCIPSSYSHKKNGEYAAAAALSFTAGRYVPLKGRSGFGASAVRHKGAFLADFSALPVPGGDTQRRVLKLKSSWAWQISPSCALETRMGGRLRNYSTERRRADFRTDFEWTDAVWMAHVRVSGAWCDGGGFLSYAEGGYSGKMLSLHLRATGFITEGWASRIYSYERDAPGNFNVPAYYGRGMALTLVCGLRMTWRFCTLKAWVRGYWMQKKPGGNTGLTLQLALSI